MNQSVKRKHFTKIFVTLFILGVALVTIGQGCSEPGNSDDPSTNKGQGNGDFYGGVQEIDFKTATDEILASSSFLKKVDIEKPGVTDSTPDYEVTDPQIAPECQLAHLNQCVDGLQEAKFVNCPTGNENVFYFGFQTINYTKLTCEANEAGDRFDHNFFVLFLDNRNGNTAVFHSLNHKDYREEEFTGGESFTWNADGFTYNTGGKKFAFNSLLLKIDTSVRTPIPFTFVVDNIDNEKSVTGSIETSHNIAEFTSEISFDNLTMNESCCHPVSGSAMIKFTGQIQGEAKATFNSCSSGTIEINGESRDIEFPECK